MKAILIAAGLGSRLGPHTADVPKCLLQVGSKSMLEHQIHAFRSNGIHDIVVINGYKAECFPDLDVTYVTNPRYRDNNILNSLMYAQELMDDGFICSYSDLVYEPAMISTLLEANGNMAVSIDQGWKDRYVGLDFHPADAMEKVLYDDHLRITAIGKAVSNDAPAEFIGLFRCDASAAQNFRTTFAKVRAEFWGKPFVQAADFEKAYLTDFLQYLIDHDAPLHGAVTRDVKWVEIDNEGDLELGRSMFA